MAFSLFCILESILLIMNAFAILNDRFLKKSKLSIKTISNTPLYSGTSCWVNESSSGCRESSTIITTKLKFVRSYLFRGTSRQLKELTNTVYIYLQKVHAVASHSPKHFLYLVRTSRRLKFIIQTLIINSWT